MNYSISTIVLATVSVAIGASLLTTPWFPDPLYTGMWRVVFVFSVAFFLASLERENEQSHFKKWIGWGSQMLMVAAIVYCIIVIKLAGWDGNP